jgi:hypothetical protein
MRLVYGSTDPAGRVAHLSAASRWWLARAGAHEGSFAFVGSHEQQPAFIADLAPEDVLETSIAGGPFYRSSLSLTTVQSYEMKIEISSIN